MNKTELVQFVSEKAKITKKIAEEAVNAVFDGIESGLKSGKNVAFVGFGTFKVSARKAREGRNPRTKEVIKIPASKSVSFRAGKSLKEAVNSK